MREIMGDYNSLDENTRKMSKIIRIMSLKFLREEAVPYFYHNKKIKRNNLFIRYRSIFMKILENPKEFFMLKIENFITD